MIKPAPSYSLTRTVEDSDVDFARRLKISSMFSFFQDIAAIHAGSLGAAVERLYEDLGVAWILMRMRVEIDRYPMLAEKISVETWPQMPRGFYERDYIIRDMDGNALVRSGSIWVIMNLETREITRSKIVDMDGIDVRKERALEKSVSRLKTIPDLPLAYEKEIRFSDVDYNKHVNNAKYVDFIMDAYSFEKHQEREIKAIEVNYINEIGSGDVLQLTQTTIEDGTDHFGGFRKADGTSVINALIEWK